MINENNNIDKITNVESERYELTPAEGNSKISK